ncbi:MAG: hypothetical protein PHV53_10360 [Fermentimonas sp.]|nr:hypothetical protein [Fermentimonas sp.]
MKKYISISFMALAILLLIVVGMLPHHHHGETACFVLEHCEQDKNINDDHTGDSEEDAPHSCFAETEYMRPSYNPINTSPIFCLIADIPVFDSEIAAFKVEYAEYLTFYKFEDTSQYNGLRAPPCMHS